MRSILFASLFLLCGCATSSWVTREYHPHKAGVVKFLDAGANFVIESRREGAMTKIKSFCEPEGYTILKESRDSSWDAYLTNPGPVNDSYTTTTASSPYLHIYFRCGELAR